MFEPLRGCGLFQCRKPALSHGKHGRVDCGLGGGTLPGVVEFRPCPLQRNIVGAIALDAQAESLRLERDYRERRDIRLPLCANSARPSLRRRARVQRAQHLMKG